MDAFKLLAAETDEDADKYADHLDTINQERKTIVASLVKEVNKTVRDRYGESIPSAIVLGNPLWRPSLLGLAANTCAQEFDRPVFLWGRDGDDVIKGSCRSEGRSNVVEIMRAAQAGTMTQFGGHQHSGGFAVSNDVVHFLEQRLNEAAQSLAGVGERAVEMIDAELKIDDFTWGLYDDIAKLAPFGKGNPKPVFLFKGVSPVAVKKFGKGNEHVELSFKRSNGTRIPAISFFGAENKWADEVKENTKIDMVASLEKSMFKGRPELRLRVVDIFVTV